MGLAFRAESAAYRLSDPDCHIPTDIALRSSDGITFGARVRNLEVFSEAFPVTQHTALPVAEVVQLPETSQTLSLLLKFMHHKTQPHCDGEDFPTLLGLAEAVEKYGVHSASEACRMLMRYDVSYD